jgi:hypothetical protein
MNFDVIEAVLPVLSAGCEGPKGHALAIMPFRGDGRRLQLG